MKKILSVLFVSGLLLLSITSLRAQTHANVKGTWNLTVETSMGSGTPRFELKHNTDTTVTGTYHGQLGETEVSGTVKGNKIYISFNISGNLIEYDGIVDGDSMKGKVKLGTMAEGTFTGTRKKS